MAANKNVIKKTGTEVVAAKGFAAYANAGMENTTADSFAIPFLVILQKGSPQVDEASGSALKGAKAGMIFENVSGKMHPGDKGVVIVPCGYRRTFIRWGARDNGGGFKGEFLPEKVAEMRNEKGLLGDLDGRTYFLLPDGSINPKKSDLLSDIRSHYVLMIDEKTGDKVQALLSLKSTQIKKSKHLMSALAEIRIDGPNGSKVTAPTFMNKVRMTTVSEKNDDGTWFGVNFALEGKFESPDDPLFLAAAAFKEAMIKGAVNVDYNNLGEAGEDAEKRKGF